MIVSRGKQEVVRVKLFGEDPELEQYLWYYLILGFIYVPGIIATIVCNYVETAFSDVLMFSPGLLAAANTLNCLGALATFLTFWYFIYKIWQNAKDGKTSSLAIFFNSLGQASGCAAATMMLVVFFMGPVGGFATAIPALLIFASLLSVITAAYNVRNHIDYTKSLADLFLGHIGVGIASFMLLTLFMNPVTVAPIVALGIFFAFAAFSYAYVAAFHNKVENYEPMILSRPNMEFVAHNVPGCGMQVFGRQVTIEEALNGATVISTKMVIPDEPNGKTDSYLPTTYGKCDY